MRSTMRQLLGGKKGHKLHEEDNRSSGLDLPPKVHPTIGVRNDSLAESGRKSATRNGKNGYHYDSAMPTVSHSTNDVGSGRNGAMPLATGHNMVHRVGDNSNENPYRNISNMGHSLGSGLENQMMYPAYNLHDDVDFYNSLNEGRTMNNPQGKSTITSGSPFNGVSASSKRSNQDTQTSPNAASPPTRLNASRNEHRNVAERSQYVNLSPSSPPAVNAYTTTNGSEPNCLRCEDEPIHTPGAVQSLGALIGIKFNEMGDLEVRIASENSRKIIGYGPEQLFALGSFLDILKEDARHDLMVRVDHCLKNASTYASTKTQTPAQIFNLSLTFPYEPDCRLWCSMHPAPNVEGLVICEFEDYSEDFYIKDVDQARALPKVPVYCGDLDHSPEEIKLSTVKRSLPLPALEIVQQKDNQIFTSLDMFSCFSQAQAQMDNCEDIQQLADVVVGIISDLIGFHRVMFYRFDNQKNGCVDAELVNPRASKDLFRGLHYPASDIPPQARELYKINRIRILYDRESETSRLVCRDDSDFRVPLDLTHSYLRAISPIHIKYLQNMGVRSTVTISIVIDNDLWGLIACHGYGEHPARISLPLRDLCRSIGDCAATVIQRITATRRVMARKLPKSFQNNSFSPTGDLLSLVDADFAALSLDKKVRAIGRMEPFDEASSVISYFQSCRIDRITSTHCVRNDFPKLVRAHRIQALCGILIVPLNFGQENDFLVFFRKGQLRHVNWAGNPTEKIYKGQDQYLEPRQSFRRYVQTVNNTSREWTEDQLDTASILALVYGRFAETWRMKSSPPREKENEKETVNDPTSASVDDTFNLKAAATRVLDALKKEAQRKSLDLTVSIHEALPTTVIGDADCFKQVMLYFIRNGFKSSQSLKVDVNLIRVQAETSYVELRVQDAGPGMSEAELDDTFQEFERAQTEEKWPFPNHRASPNQSSESNRGNVTLSVVATFVRSINGQIQVTSELGKGTIFTVELPYKCAKSVDDSVSSNTNPPVPEKSPTFTPQPLAETRTKSTTSTPAFNSSTTTYTPGHLQPAVIPMRRPASESQAYNNDQTDVDDSTTIGQNSENHALAYYESNSQQDKSIYRQTYVDQTQINVLIADSDLVSLRLVEDKLSQFGYSVIVAHDGQECHDCFALNPAKVDVILMELKMPFVDGVLSTRMIRIAEKEAKHRAASEYTPYSKQRVPIIAISYTLDENSRFDYIQSGFDGWILKPIDFHRLGIMLQGLNNPQMRQEALYVPGQLKKGGWFLP
ncbi:hypothetical protein K3495_g1682 [Podosphaera aphanis]|nr:hypothetical protein K3495_g1682 [Podosphaera aphanis]